MHHPSGRQALRDYFKDEDRVMEIIGQYVELARSSRQQLRAKALDAAGLKEERRKWWLAFGFLIYDFDLHALEDVIERLRRFDDSVPKKYTDAGLWMTRGPTALDAQIKASKSAFAHNCAQ